MSGRPPFFSSRLNDDQSAIGPIGRLGFWCAAHGRLVVVFWALVFGVFGLAFAPRAEDELAGAGWENSGAESVAARDAIEGSFPGFGSYSLAVVVDAGEDGLEDPVVARTMNEVAATLDAEPAVSRVVEPGRNGGISRDGRVAVFAAGAAGDENEMVHAAGRLSDELEGVGPPGVVVSVTGLPGFWSDFNEASKEAMISAEFRSWPVTLIILAIAFGSLVAAGLPLLLTILGLASAIGALWIGAQFGDISIWAVNFALMFALAVGIDYALFIVVRFRASMRAGRVPRAAVTETMETAGKAVLLSGLTVVASLLALLLIPSPPFQTTAIGMALAVLFVLGASLTLLPAVLARLGDRVDRVALPWKGAVAHRSEHFARWATIVWRRPLLTGAVALASLLALMVPLLFIQTEMPSIRTVPGDAPARVGQERIAEAFGEGVPDHLDVVIDAASAGQARRAVASEDGLAPGGPVLRSRGSVLVRAVPEARADRDLLAGLRDRLPEGAMVGGPAAERLDLESMLSARLPLLYAGVIGVAFLILLVALRAPLVALASVLLNVLATGAAFGIAVLVFQEGVGASLLGLEAQGHITAWGPIFFFTLIFALAMDYTVFLLSSVKQLFERTGDAKHATIEGMATSGRVINAAAAVMVFVFLTFSLAGVLPPKEMGAILGLAVLLDATLIRLLLLPAILRLLGERAWQVPRPIDRWLPEVRISHGD
jgi:putative drug exporter of the RND superfamily